MNLQELGEILRQERERQGLTLAEVAQKTKISRRSIEALEKGLEDELPHPVYAKGFVKNYARLLGLDADKLGNVMSGEYGVEEDDFGEDPIKAQQISLPVKTIGTFRRKLGLPSVLIVLLVLLAAVGLLWFLSGPSEHETAPKALAPPQKQERAVYQNASAKAPKKDASENATKPKAQQAGPLPPKARNASRPAPQKIQKPKPPAKKTTPPANTAAPKEKPANQASQPQRIEILARELCWLYAEVDNATTLDIILRAGERKTLRFSKNLKVRFGNAGGVSLRYNGEDFPFTANSGQVKTFIFP
ncbi:MAG: DUF4115 domain-containing protein [Thermodesulfobacteriota bacterium]|nr:DUF4115 domain-containing protein [Thermodesulfobacteriota bacterium]